MMKAKPFYTAPKDGTWVLAFLIYGRVWVSTYWWQSCWRTYGSNINYYDDHFSHWLPMPEIPQAEGDDHE